MSTFIKGAFGFVIVIIIASILKFLFGNRQSDIDKYHLESAKTEKKIKEQSKIMKKDFERLQENNDTSMCFINTTGVSRSNDVKIKIYRQCKWKEYNDNYEIPTLMCQFAYESDKFTTAESINISSELPDKVIAYMKSKKNINKTLPEDDKYISSNSIDINGITANEILFSKIISSENGIAFMNSVMYQLFINKNVVSVTFFILASTKKQTEKIFEKNVPLFRRIIYRTEVL